MVSAEQVVLEARFSAVSPPSDRVSLLWFWHWPLRPQLPFSVCCRSSRHERSRERDEADGERHGGDGSCGEAAAEVRAGGGATFLPLLWGEGVQGASSVAVPPKKAFSSPGS